MANNSTTQEQLVVHGALPMVLQMAENLTDLESQRQALLALSNLAVCEVNHMTMMNKGIMKVLTNAFKSLDPECREYPLALQYIIPPRLQRRERNDTFIPLYRDLWLFRGFAA
jgi:hypothetical protein